MKEKVPLSVTHPELAAEWDLERNFPLTPDRVTYGSHKEFYWLCTDYRHSYQLAIKRRTLHKQGCPSCWTHPGKLSLEDARTIARKRGGKLLSAVYKNVATKLLWSCDYGHQWAARLSDVKNKNSWCPECASNKKRTLKEMQEIAVSRGGTFLSTEYRGMNMRHTWRCADGHEWDAKPANVIFNNTWCPHCSSFLTENKCRYIFERLFGVPFTKNRNVLQGKELDGYNESLQLAFEFQGEQHYKLHWKFSSTFQDLETIQTQDKAKKALCDKLGICLIEIPYWEAKGDEQLTAYILKKLEEQKSFTIDASAFSFEDFYAQLGELKELQALAEERGGKCLSRSYLGVHYALRWECSNGHQWSAPPKRIQGSWCPDCAGNKRLTLEIMQDFAGKRGGKCLSTDYKSVGDPLDWQCRFGHKWAAPASNLIYREKWCPECESGRIMQSIRSTAHKLGWTCLSDTFLNEGAKMQWQCALGHVWSASYARIKSGAGCPICSINTVISRKLTELNNIASERGGRCLSIHYSNNKTPLNWECHLGHKWQASPQDIKNKRTWCPSCAGKQKISLEDLRTIALKQGGRCLSTTYDNGSEKVEWECSKGHRWLASVNSVKHQQSWCPVCSGNRKKTIEDMRRLAEERGGECLSATYHGNKEKLDWRCQTGHIFSARPNDIMSSGSWCPQCRKKSVL